MADRCTATSRQTGQQCGNWATPGATVCRFHGSRAPQVAAKAQQRIEQEQAAEVARSFGVPRDVDPTQAILEELHRTAGVVAWLGGIVAELDKGQITQGVAKIETFTDHAMAAGIPNANGQRQGRIVTVDASVNTWVRLWQDERKHYAAVAAAAHKMGIDVAQTKIIETTGMMLAAAITRILDQLTLSEQQQTIAGQVVPNVLRSLTPEAAQ